MKTSFSEADLAEMRSKLSEPETSISSNAEDRRPVHVVYGGAHLFKAETPHKLGKIAAQSLELYAPNFAELARAMWLKGADSLPRFADDIQNLEFRLIENGEKAKLENRAAWLAHAVYERITDKLQREPVEDFRIDFEDGYGLRSDSEEDAHAVAASDELALSLRENTITPFCGFRIKSLQSETRVRAVRTLDLFLTNLLENTGGKLPENFVVTLPKIVRREEVAALDDLLSVFEKRNDLPGGAIKIEIMIETPQSIVNERGEIAPRKLVEAGNGRVIAAHFGAYDYTASFGISGIHQHLRHEACNNARQVMLIALAPLGVRLSDSVTTEMPIPVFKGENLRETEIEENRRAVHSAWRKHFNNVTNSLINGFYQSWDLHPAQLAARYAAVYSFFLESADEQAKRLKSFIEAATRATTTGNAFDDAASAQGLLNFFARALYSGAMTEAEVEEKTDLSAAAIKSASFAQILEEQTAKNNQKEERKT